MSNYDNSGSITSPSFGVSLQSGSGSSTSADNRGTIQGFEEAVISSGIGAVTLSNEGDIEGNVDLHNTGGDTLANAGSIRGDVLLGNGENTFDGRGGTATGEITGGSGSDTIRAGSDGETMNGGLGHDNLYGGSGADVFVFTSSGAANWDHVYDFNVGKDLIQLAHSDFSALAKGAKPVFSIATAATGATDHLFYSTSGGGLWYDPDGSGPKAAVEIANLGAGLKLIASNFEVV